MSFFKIGLWLLFAPGAERFIDGLIGQGKRVFLDAKMYDIGETVRQGVARATERGVSLVTVHGDPEIMRAAVAGKAGSARTKVFAISVLTSLTMRRCARWVMRCRCAELIRLRVRQAVECGCDGIIASADDDPNAIRRMAERGASADRHARHSRAGRDDGRSQAARHAGAGDRARGGLSGGGAADHEGRRSGGSGEAHHCGYGTERFRMNGARGDRCRRIH